MRSIILVMVTLALALTGCQQAAQMATEKMVEQSTGVQVRQSSDSVTIKGKEGETITVKTGVPDALKDFPMPQGFTPDASSGGSVSAKTGEAMSVASWKGTGTVQAATDYFKKAMVDQGWKQELAQDMGDMAQLHYSKGEEQAILIVTKQSNDLKIQVMLGKSVQQ